MTLLGELYANGYGVNRDDTRRSIWYSLAADRGDREAMFALAMMPIAGRGAPRSRGRGQAAGVAAKLGNPLAAYNLGAALHRGPGVSAGPRTRRRAVSAGGGCRQPGSAIRAGDVLQGRPRRATKDPAEAARWLGRRRRPTISTPRSNTPSRCSTAPASPRTRPRPSRCSEGGAARQPDRAEPARAHSGHRPWARRRTRSRRSNGT